MFRRVEAKSSANSEDGRRAGWQGERKSEQARRAGAGTVWQWRSGAGSTRGPRHSGRCVSNPGSFSCILLASLSPFLLALLPLLLPTSSRCAPSHSFPWHPHRCLCPPHACGFSPQTALSSSQPPLTLNSPRPPHLPGSPAPPHGLFPSSVAPSVTVFMPLQPGHHCYPTPFANLLTSSDSADLRVDHINSMTATKTAMMRPQISTTKMPPMFSMPRPGGRGRARG